MGRIKEGVIGVIANPPTAVKQSYFLSFPNVLIGNPFIKGEKIYKNELRSELIRLTKKCGFPDVTKLHTLRHTFASHLVMGGIDLPTVKKLMGHSDIETTMIYSHLADEHIDKAVEKLEF